MQVTLVKKRGKKRSKREKEMRKKSKLGPVAAIQLCNTKNDVVLRLKRSTNLVWMDF